MGFIDFIIEIFCRPFFVGAVLSCVAAQFDNVRLSNLNENILEHSKQESTVCTTGGTVCHQNASENRPIGTSKTEKIVDSFPYAPFPPEAHDAFVRLRRDITAESNIVSILYRVLHVHCHDIQDESKFKPDVSIYNYNRL